MTTTTQPGKVLEEGALAGLEDQPVLSIRARVRAEEADGFATDALRHIRVYMQEHHVRPDGPPFSISRPQGRECDVEAGWPTTLPVQGAGRIHGGALPLSLLEPGTHERIA